MHSKKTKSGHRIHLTSNDIETGFIAYFLITLFGSVISYIIAGWYWVMIWAISMAGIGLFALYLAIKMLNK